MSFHNFSVRMGFKEQHDIYEYGKVSEYFKRQFILIIRKEVKNNTPSENNLWLELSEDLKIEFSKTLLANENTALESILKYFWDTNDLESLYIVSRVLETLKNLQNQYIKWADEGYGFNNYNDDEYYKSFAGKMGDIINLVNAKLFENGIGYEFINNQFVKIENQYIHSNIVKEAFQLLQHPDFTNVSKEFMKAHEHFKNDNNKDAITNAGKAFESTMKVICSNLEYDFDNNRDTASKLINILMMNEFIPSYLQDHLTGIQKVLVSGLPTLRNKVSHGEGDSPIEIPPSLVKYILNLCATNIVFLVNIYMEKEELKKK